MARVLSNRVNFTMLELALPSPSVVWGINMQLAALAVPVMALHLWAAAAEPPPMALPGCPTTCGDVRVPYPFGISADCYLPGFNLTCDRGHNPPRLLLGDGDGNGDRLLQVTDIYLDNATMRVMSGPPIINHTSRPSPIETRSWMLPIDGHGPYVLSYDHNKFIVVGCGVRAMLLTEARLYDREVSRCFSQCRTDDRSHWMPTEGGGCSKCSGNNGCCQASINSLFLPSYMVDMEVFHPEREVLTFAALIAEQGWIDGHWCRMAGSSWPFGTRPSPPDLSTVPVVLEWAMNTTLPTYPEMVPDDISRCPMDGASSACKSNNSLCNDKNSIVRSGYSCHCSAGYYGNPYLNDGCQDIDECANPEYYGCYGECVNMPGTFLCRCPHGSHGNSSVAHGCVKSSTGLSIGLGVGSGAMVFLFSLGTTFIVRKIKARRKKKLRETFFKQNHGQLLQQLVCHMADIGERMIVTLDEIEKATNNFDRSRELGDGGHGTVYKGILSSQHVVAIKKSKIVIQREINEFINEVAILSQVNHRNIVKLLGCCLETEVPLLIYEFISNGTLYGHLHVDAPISISWKDRLRIAIETARALTYLHSLVSMSIIHRDIKSPNILLDDNLTVKLSDFGASRYIPIDQEGIHTTVQGTLGYLDPMYHSTGHLTEKSDVYSFGVLLIELLTRKKPVSYRSSQGFVLVNHFLSLLSESNLDEILDPQISKEGDGEVVDIALLAAICVKFRGEERPTMRQIEMTLESIQAAKEFSSDVTDDDISSEII
ncbi:unnamed protein product [Urochloa decumbens]|uniref:Protein kinase domain-containing protein n=1 Tax=Urochloa decumbens TaxID=240449 RepID=A0ABC9AYK7_9POAL